MTMIEHKLDMGISNLRVSSTAKGFLPVATTALASQSDRVPIAWAVAAHGGAGATTLASVLAPVADSQGQWPAYDQHPFCVVVCRSTWTGLDAAHSAILQGQSGDTGGCIILGVVIIDDSPGKTPKLLLQRERVLEDLTTVWKVPYVRDFRVYAPDELAVWVPGKNSGDATRGRRRKKLATKVVPEALVELGQEIFQAACAAYKDQEKE